MKRWWIVVVVLMTAYGCGKPSGPPKVQDLPIKGTVTLDGKPLSGADVVFMTGNPPVPFASRTKDDGTYQLQSVAGRNAKCEGDCKVTISRLAKPDGSPLGPDETPAEAAAVEQLPPRYSQFDSTILAKTIPAEGGTFDFALESK